MKFEAELSVQLAPRPTMGGESRPFARNLCFGIILRQMDAPAEEAIELRIARMRIVRRDDTEELWVMPSGGIVTMNQKLRALLLESMAANEQVQKMVKCDPKQVLAKKQSRAMKEIWRQRKAEEKAAKLAEYAALDAKYRAEYSQRKEASANGSHQGSD